MRSPPCQAGGTASLTRSRVVRAANRYRRHNLPHQLTNFIGREKEIAQARQLLASTRLLTLTGAGGCGKTRLALQVAGDVLADYRGWRMARGARRLERRDTRPQTVAGVFAVKEQAGRTSPGRSPNSSSQDKFFWCWTTPSICLNLLATRATVAAAL